MACRQTKQRQGATRMKKTSLLLLLCGLFAGAVLTLGWQVLGRDDDRRDVSAEEPTLTETPKGREITTLGGGCFWCLEAVFEEMRGVDKVVSGYSGGRVS